MHFREDEDKDLPVLVGEVETTIDVSLHLIHSFDDERVEITTGGDLVFHCSNGDFRYRIREYDPKKVTLSCTFVSRVEKWMGFDVHRDERVPPGVVFFSPAEQI